jgi:fatty-acyl-CoA synthase
MNVGQWVYKRAVTDPDAPFLKEAEGEEKDFTNRQFNERVNRMTHVLAELGVKQGERVCALLLNSSEFFEIFFACAKTGAIMVPLNFRLAVPELSFIVGDARPRALVYSHDFSEKVMELREKCRDVSHFIGHGGALSGDREIGEFAVGYPSGEPEVTEEVIETDPLVIMYTSGTTGDPKGAVISHKNIIFDAVHNLIGYGVNRSFRSLVSSPLFHIGALAASSTPVIYAGGSLVLRRFFNASEIIRLIQNEKVNYMFSIPVMFQMMSEAAEWEAADFSHVNYFFAGGAPMPVPLIQKYQGEKGVSFAQGYGMTEACQVSALGLGDSVRKTGSVGKEVFHVLLRIVDEKGADVPAGEVGEVIIRGPTVFSGYWDRPNETEKAFKQGWFYTGDMGRKDEEGFLYLVGRKVEMIISSGVNIYPAEVERALVRVPEVSEAAVLGMPDRIRGEAVCAFVSLAEGKSISETALVDALRGKIADFKIPKKITFVDDFPRNPQGKILKQELKKKLTPNGEGD